MATKNITQRGDSFRASIMVRGSRETATFDSEKEARAWILLMKAKGAETSHKLGGGTNEQLFETFLDKVASKTDTAKWNRLRLMKWCQDPLAKKYASETTTHDINEWIDRSLSDPSKRTGEPVSGATVNRELNLMSSAFNYAKDALKWISVNPCHGAARPERGKARNRPLQSPQEIRSILIATGYDADPNLKTKTSRVGACYLLALETGMRSGEILRLRPQDYFKAERRLRVMAEEKGGRKASKSGRATVSAARDVPLTPQAIEVLDQLLRTMPEDQEPQDGMNFPPYLVGLNDSQRDALWRKARTKAAVADLHFHDMKHEAATRLSKFIDVLALSHAIGTKDIRLLRDTYYNADATRTAALLPDRLSTEPSKVLG